MYKVGDRVVVDGFYQGVDGTFGEIVRVDEGANWPYKIITDEGFSLLLNSQELRLEEEMSMSVDSEPKSPRAELLDEARHNSNITVTGGVLNFDEHKIKFPHEDQSEATPRAEVLDEAKSLITGDRNNAYGEPTQDFQRSADAATGLGYGKKDHEGNWVALEAHDIAILVMMIKTSRLQWSPGKKDHWSDIAGYAGCGYECAVKEGHTS